jgi:hypothetical protein
MTSTAGRDEGRLVQPGSGETDAAEAALRPKQLEDVKRSLQTS